MAKKGKKTLLQCNNTMLPDIVNFSVIFHGLLGRTTYSFIIIWERDIKR
ncbi:10568_t:CDS:2 [Rhizophagus irregularis]|nr:10568_t:CDS:2 [Rhizophagus irregularis]